MPPKYPGRDRAWGTRYDTLESSPPSTPSKSSPATGTYAYSPSTSLSIESRSTMPTRQSSIFVGSLPANVEHAELTRLLAQHLCQYSQVKSVKVVNDSKGGVCAFVQCENSASATRMLEGLQSQPPEPFLGRILRYEPARAYRTLLISYRNHAESPATKDSLYSGDAPLDRTRRPFALRIYRPQNAKHLAILYNREAVDYRPGSPSNTDNTSMCNDVFAGAGLLMSTLNYGSETIKTLIYAFGDVESLQVREARDADVGMKPHTWEVKWECREDCVAAFMTLRRLPFLLVDWAHQASTTGGHLAKGETRSALPRSSPRGALSRLNSPHRPMRDSDTQSPTSPMKPPSPPLMGSPAILASNLHSPQSAFSPRSEKWGFAHSTPLLGTPTPPLSLHHLTLQENPPFRWADEELPAPPAEGDAAHARVYDSSHTQLDGLSSGLNVVPHEGPPAIPFTPTRSRPETGLSFRTPQSGASSSIPVPGGQLEGEYSIRHGIFTPRSAKKYSRGNSGGLTSGPQRAVDPTTIFVGGLDNLNPDYWDEGRLRGIFTPYGDIQYVQVVRPLNKKSAFAFVRFESAEAAAKAVAQEHNRAYEGRQLRVQLRDIHTGRGPLKFDRSRGDIASPSRYPNLRNENKWGIAKDTGPFNGQVHACQENMRTAHSMVQQTSLPTSQTPSSLGHDRQDQGLISHTQSPIRRHSVSEISSQVTDGSLAVSEAPNSSQPGLLYTQQTNSLSVPATMMAPMTLQSYQSMPVPYYPYQYPSWVPTYPPHYAHPSLMPPVRPYARSPAPVTGSSSPMDAVNANGAAQSVSVASYPPMSYGTYPMPGAPGHPAGQPPLRPTGFVQGTQGMLVPVYQREALDHYMSNTQHNPPASGQLLAQPQAWGYYPQVPMYPYGIPVASRTTPSPASQPTQNPRLQAWTPNPPPYAAIAQQTPQRPYLLPTASSSSVSTCSEPLSALQHTSVSPNRRRFDQRGSPRRPNGGQGQYGYGRGPERGQDFNVAGPSGPSYVGGSAGPY